MYKCILFSLLRWRQANSSGYIAVFRGKFVQGRQNLKVSYNLGYHCFDFQKSKLLSNAIPRAGTKRHVLEGTGLFLFEALGSELMWIIENSIIITQDKKAQVQRSALGYYLTIWKSIEKVSKAVPSGQP